MILSRLAAWFMGSTLGRWLALALLILGAALAAAKLIDRNAVHRTLAEERARAARRGLDTIGKVQHETGSIRTRADAERAVARWVRAPAPRQ